MVKKVSKVVASKTKKESEKKVTNAARINRIVGQAVGIQKMIESKRARIDVITQLRAVRAAVKALESEVLEEHLIASVVDLSSGTAAQKSKKITDLKKIFLRSE